MPTEEVPPGWIPGVSVRGLEKRFPGTPQPALRGLSLDFCQGQITALLGHNGDGKATVLWVVASVLISPWPQLAHLLNGRGVWGLHRGSRDPQSTWGTRRIDNRVL